MKEQREICMKFGAEYFESGKGTKVGIALHTLQTAPLNALRHPPEGDTCGWYIWGGGEIPNEPEYFAPLHAEHISEYCPAIEKYLGLPPGWRILIAEEYEDVWYDPSLFNI